MSYGRRTFAGACVAVVLLSGATWVAVDAVSQEQAQGLVSTTTDLKQDYEVIGVLAHYQELGIGIKGDPLERAVAVGWEKFQEKVKKAGATGVVGVRVEFANRTEKDEGRVLIYGTAVRLR